MSTITVAGDTFDHPGWSRRGFLAGGSALLGALLLGGDLSPPPTLEGFEKLLALGDPRIPVAYLEGSELFTSLPAALAGGAVRAVPAVAIAPLAALRDRSLAMTVHGFTPGLGAADAPFDSVYLDSLIPAPVGADAATIPFYAWTYRRAPASTTTGRSRVVVAGGDGLRVGVKVSSAAVGAAATAARTEAVTVFTSRSERDLPKLRPGVYLLGLDETLWRDPRQLPDVTDPEWSGLASMVVSVEAQP